MANSYLNEYNTIAEMNTAYEEGHDESWVAYCAEDNSLYYQQKTKIASKYFDNLEYNSENKTLEFYIDGDLKKSIDVSPWWFEKDSYYTREETNELLNTKFDSVKYDSSARTINFYVGEEIKNSIDATDFIKDGMVNTVTVEVINGVSYLAITFNEDEEGKKTHDTIYLELTKIFNPENYYTKIASDSKYVNAIGTSGNNLTYTIGDNTNNLTVPYANSAGNADTVDGLHFYGGSRNMNSSPINSFYRNRIVVNGLSANTYVKITNRNQMAGYIGIGIDQDNFPTFYNLYFNGFAWDTNYYVEIINRSGYGNAKIPAFYITTNEDWNSRKCDLWIKMNYPTGTNDLIITSNVLPLDGTIYSEIPSDYTIIQTFSLSNSMTGSLQQFCCGSLRVNDTILSESELIKLKALIS